MMKKAIATAPGEPTQYLDLTPDEVTEIRASWDAPQPPPPLAEQLRAFFEESLSPELQADFATLKAAVKLELEQGRTGIAKLIIQRARIPAELEPVRAKLVEKFP